MPRFYQEGLAFAEKIGYYSGNHEENSL